MYSKLISGIKLGMANPIGPIQLRYIKEPNQLPGILKVLQSRYGKSKYAPSLLPLNIFTACNLGIKSDQGFYSWGHGIKDLIVKLISIN